MKFLVAYKVFTFPNDVINSNIEKQTFTFTYEASVKDLGDLSNSINTYLQKYFTKDNYELLGFEQIIEPVNE